jgi:hypothetical protein
MNSNKRSSEFDGRQFLGQALAQEQLVLAGQLRLSMHSITHNGRMGEVNEQLFIDVLRRYLPRRYGVEQGIVIDSNGNTSDQIDIVIYDHQYPLRCSRRCPTAIFLLRLSMVCWR